MPRTPARPDADLRACRPLGGENDDAVPLATALRFDPATNAIASFANLATPRSLFALGRLADARILITGGIIGQTQSDIAETTETLALDATRREGPVMSNARWLHTATPLMDGRLLIVGASALIACRSDPPRSTSDLAPRW